MPDSFNNLNKPGAAGGRVGWSVGRFDWLNDPASKVNRYWRVIEEGSSATKWPWQGETIVGLWGPKAGPRGALISGDLDAMTSGRNNQKFVPFFRTRGADLVGAARAALWFYFQGGKGPNMDQLRVTHSRHEGGRINEAVERRRIFFWLMTRARLDQMPFVSGVVVRPIEPAAFYSRALVSFDPMSREIEAIRKGVQSMIGAEFNVHTPKGLAEARDSLARDSGSYKGVRGSLSPGDAIGRTPAAATGKPRTFVRAAPLPVSMASATLGATSQDFLRDGKGRFSSGAWLDMLTEVNRRIAREYQDHLVELMKAERKRPPSGDLIKATQAEQNRYPA